MQNIFWGIVIITIGLVSGNSVFLGDFGLLSIFFDGLGCFWLGKGIVGLVRARQQGT